MERFGKFWGAFSVIDLFILNALTIVTEFIGITLAAGYLGLPKVGAVALAALVIVGAAFTGSFRRFERIAMFFCAGSLLLIPLYFFAHPRVAQMAHDFVIPQLPGGSGQLATVMLLVIGLVGTTVAPWQLFFQQSYVIDKRITPRFMRYEKADLWIGIVIVVIGGAAIMGGTAAAFAGTNGFGHFTDAAGLASGLQAYAGHAAGVIFAVALLDASIIGAFAVSLSTAYAIGDVFGLKHSLHRGVKGAKGFYAVYAGLIAAAATIVLIPGSPLGLLTEGVQTLAGVLLPSATVFLLLLCNDAQVLGPWVNGRKTNLFTGAVVAVLISLSVILTASVLFPSISSRQIVEIMIGCGAGTVLAGAYLSGRRLLRGTIPAGAGVPASAAVAAGTAAGTIAAGTAGAGTVPAARTPAAMKAVADGTGRNARDNWRMPPLALLQRPVMSTGRKIGMSALRIYLAVAMVLVILKVVELAIGH
jgi:Mn2+/Fe2+ NRAMP family transporter